MREIRPITELGSRIQEAGRIRLGIKGPKGAPKAIDTFRFTSVHQDLIEQLATLYGGTARPWSDAKAGAKDQFEVITTAKSIRVFVPPGGLSQDYELWSGARCERRCDGVTAEVPSRGPDGVQSVPCVCHAKQKLECKPVTRLTVVLPELPFRGVWRMETKSWNAADELNAMERMIDSLQETRDIVAAELHIEQRSRMTSQGKRNFVVPVLTLSSTLEALAAGDTGLRAISAGSQLLEAQYALEAGMPVHVVKEHLDATRPEVSSPDKSEVDVVGSFGEDLADLAAEEDDDVAEAELVYEAEEVKAEAERLANLLLLDPIKFRTAVCLGSSDGVKVDETLLDDDERAKAMDFLDRVARNEIEVVGIQANHRLQIRRGG